MIKYVCIDSNSYSYMIGQIYQIKIHYRMTDETTFFTIYNEAQIEIGSWFAFIEKFFIPLSEWRNNQIDSILNE